MALIRARLPSAMAICGFGSQLQGTAGPDSDLDLAVLVAGYADPLALWDAAGALADVQAGLFEGYVLSEKTELDTARAPLLADIKARGRVYGR